MEKFNPHPLLLSVDFHRPIYDAAKAHPEVFCPRYE